MVKTGIDVLQKQQFAPLKGLACGLFTNLAACDAHFSPTYRILTESDRVQVRALFAPEHGFAGSAPEGAHIAHDTDPRTGLPVHSLYGSSLKPTPEMLTGLDAILCDIQDVGVRYYTFTWTLAYILEAAGQEGIRVIILDRPNPLGGEVRGAPLDMKFSSLVGRFPVPTCHGMTIGELARMINAQWNPHPASLTVIPCEGWQHDLIWDQTGLGWVAPSPNMPRFQTAQHYPGSCLIEGTILSEGRGTTLPFQITGAPFVDGFATADALNALVFRGVRFRPHYFQPTGGKWAGMLCGGVQVHLTDASVYDPLEVWLGVITTLRDLYPSHFAWLPPHNDIYHFDRLIGSDQPRMQIEHGETFTTISAGWADFVKAFHTQRSPYLLYP